MHTYVLIIPLGRVVTFTAQGGMPSEIKGVLLKHLLFYRRLFYYPGDSYCWPLTLGLEGGILGAVIQRILQYHSLKV